MKTIENWYVEKINHTINAKEFLPILHNLAKECDTVVEFGVRDMSSSYAFARAKPKKLICVDPINTQEIDSFLTLCKNENVQIEFICQSTLEIKLEEVDLLFINTLHTYSQLLKELTLHSNKVKKYIILSGTTKYSFLNELNTPDRKQGIIFAIENFLQENSMWSIQRHLVSGDGLMILRKQE